MKHFKRALLGATALTAMTGMAFAQSNEATTSQNGASNTLLVDQSQTRDGSNYAGSAAQAIRQDGDDNEIDISQFQNGTSANGANNVGTGGDVAGNGVDQIDNNNVLMIDQKGDGQDVFDVLQKGRQTAGSTGTANKTEITQTGRAQTVSNIRQQFRGASTDSANEITINQSASGNYVGSDPAGPRSGASGIYQLGNGNSADVTQGGGGNNRVLFLQQKDTQADAGSNNATVVQSGNHNMIALIDQFNDGASDNSVAISQIGSQNGHNTGLTSAAAGSVGLAMQTAKQSGSGNDLDYAATGDNNTFGFSQIGADNDIDGWSTGSNNEMAILQNGDRNSAAANQQGNDNAIGAKMIGNDNRLNMMQDDNGGLGGNNSIQVSIRGDGNNNWQANLSPALSGDALTARNVARAQGGMFASLGQGDLFQNGSDNSMTLSVNGNGNAFGMAQNGDSNTISGTISYGSGNQAVVAQVSNGNSATFSIGGTGNVTGIVQGN